GRLRTRSWEDKEGNKKFATEVVGDNLIMLDKRGEGQGFIAGGGHHENLEGISNADIPPIGETSEDLPF
ncbi:MAG TPA: single-stranded DNA-binding protein, partial [Segetibacter sp.]